MARAARRWADPSHLGDFDSDGVTDLVDRHGEGVNVRLGDGDGTFMDAIAVWPALAATLRIADLNDDGVPDFVSGDAGGPNDDPPSMVTST